MPILLDERPAASVNDVEIVGVNFSDHLNSGELLTGAPTAVEQDGADLTIGTVYINTVAYTEAYSKDTVPVGHAVLFSITSAVSGDYTVRIMVDTDSTPVARRFYRDIFLRFV